MNEYNKAQIDYRDGCKSRIKRQMEISKRPLSFTPLPSLPEQKNSSSLFFVFFCFIYIFLLIYIIVIVLS